MLKQTVAFTDFDDNEAQETLYFNLTKTELAEQLSLKEELEKIEKDFTGERQRQLEAHEIQRLLDLVKTLMRISYGVRSADGKRFMKSEEQWNEFTQTAVYDAFLFSLFENPSNAMAFMTGILPKQLRTAALEAAKKSGNTVVANAFEGEAQLSYDKLTNDVPLPEVITKKADFAPEVTQAPVQDSPLGSPNTEASMEEFLAWKRSQQQ